MFCQRCGNEVGNEVNFCSKCGNAIEDQTIVQGFQMTPPKNDGKAIASFVLGIIGLVTWIVPLLGFPITIIGLVLASLSLNRGQKGKAVVGLVLCILGLVATIINSAIGAYLGATGQL